LPEQEVVVRRLARSQRSFLHDHGCSFRDVVRGDQDTRQRVADPPAAERCLQLLLERAVRIFFLDDTAEIAREDVGERLASGTEEGSIEDVAALVAIKGDQRGRGRGRPGHVLRMGCCEASRDDAAGRSAGDQVEIGVQRPGLALRLEAPLQLFQHQRRHEAANAAAIDRKDAQCVRHGILP
jgi:hypothetical protein